ncbi:MAG: GuaB3 family IMP dehydrogenase-related protein [Chloroflexi bacterium]|nr:GuaB3 family IMP dehydrogenase-related protein [Chloroflexota bacterium]|tara:strand:+ start:197 stop:1327 length:1131 start_codon:yes stop_codon:yes gene_type:complete
MKNNSRKLKNAYGFDDVSISPGEITINPELTDTSFEIGDISLKIPFLASAMDAISSPEFINQLDKLGGLAVLNLDGIYCRYENTEEIFQYISKEKEEKVTELMQKIYSEPIKKSLIEKRILQIKNTGSKCAVSIIPANTKKTLGIIKDAGADILIIQSTVTTAKHRSNSPVGLIFSEIKKNLKMPVLVGNTVSYSVTKDLMKENIDGILVGVGPGAACTSREVLGIGVPQVTATLDCSLARDDYFNETGRYVPIITDGGIRTGGDVCKSIASGADAVMIGTPFAQTLEAPGLGYNWGMATPHDSLPRGTRINVGTKTKLKTLLFGPSSSTDGTLNLVGALKISMGMLGAKNIKQMHKSELVLAPSIKTEGKIFQQR